VNAVEIADGDRDRAERARPAGREAAGDDELAPEAARYEHEAGKVTEKR
jgi:hypothetical protein